MTDCDSERSVSGDGSMWSGVNEAVVTDEVSHAEVGSCTP